MSTVSHQEPEAPAIYDARARRFDHLWLEGAIGNATYVRSMMIDGMHLDVANSRLALLKLEKQERHRK